MTEGTSSLLPPGVGGLETALALQAFGAGLVWLRQ